MASAFLSVYPLHDAVIIRAVRPARTAHRLQRQGRRAEFPAPITLFNTHLDTKEDPTMRLDQVRS